MLFLKAPFSFVHITAFTTKIVHPGAALLYEAQNRGNDVNLRVILHLDLNQKLMPDV
jgi:hypothetical protein